MTTPQHPESALRLLRSTHPMGSVGRPGYAVHRDQLPHEQMSDLHHHQTDEGVVQRIADRRAFAYRDLEFSGGIFRLEPGHEHVLHLHRAAAEFYYILAGTADVTVGDELIKATPGLCVYIPPGMPHGVRKASAQGFEFIYMFSEPDPSLRETVWLDDADS